MRIGRAQLGWKLLSVLFIAGVVLTPFFAVTQASAAQVPGVNGLIAYSKSSFAGDIKTFNPNTSVTKTLNLDSPSSYYGPAWSPDGTKIAYLTSSAPTTLNVVKADGTPLITLADGRFYGEVGWSPDGTKFVTATRGGGSIFNLFTMNIDGTNYTQIVSSVNNLRHGQWSPSGTKIAYDADADHDIHVVNPDGSGGVNLTNGHFTQSSDPTWSPDGTKVMFETHDGSNNLGIGVVNADGTGITTITSSALGGAPVWSPDGTKIAYADSNHKLHIMNANGTSDSIVSTDDMAFIDWQPLTLKPQGSANPILTTSGGKATLDVPANYTDQYGGGIDKATIVVTSAPAHGTAVVDQATGVITYTAKTVSVKHNSFFDTLGALISPRAYAADPSDQFGFRVCTITSPNLCSTVTASVLAGAPNTGAGMPRNNLPAQLVGLASVVTLGAGLLLIRSNWQKRPSAE